jgi:hypothetical protein
VGDRAVFANDRYVSGNFFTVFGQSAAAGRLLTARDVPADTALPTVAVVAYGWATAHFGSAEAALGKLISGATPRPRGSTRSCARPAVNGANRAAPCASR